MAVRSRMAAILLLLICLFSASVRSCHVDDVAVYKVTLRTVWNEETFHVGHSAESKTQWSDVLGQSHNKSYALYHVGETASPLVKDFAQLAALDQLIETSNEEPKVYDQFTAPAIKDGVGETENVVFVDGGHSLVSLICRMVPSPDWFVGVDSLDLCVDSSWVDQVVLDLELLDAGVVDITKTEQGFWPRNTIQPVHKIHQADSRYNYRKMRQLPAIAKVEFVKIKEYSTIELNNLARKELISNVKQKRNFSVLERLHNYEPEEDEDYQSNIKDDQTTKNPYDELKDLEEEPVGTPRPHNPNNNVIVVTKSPDVLSEEEYDEKLKNMDDVVLAVANGHKLGLHRHLPRHFRSRLHHAVNRNQHKDCLVSEWSKWSECSDPCSKGKGQMTRLRFITQERKHGGKECPNLTESKACGHKCRDKDCLVSEWSKWSECSDPCSKGKGQMTRLRFITQERKHGGKECPNLTESKACGHKCRGDDAGW